MEATAPQTLSTAQAQDAPRITPRANPRVFWKLLRFTLSDYFRTPWVFLNVAILVGVHAVFFTYKSGQSHFFGIEYAAAMLQAALTCTVMFSRSNRAESYAILARQVPRASYVGAVMLAAWLVAALAYALSALFDMVYFSEWVTGQPLFDWQTPTNYALGSLPVLVGAAFAVCLVTLLSTFVSTSAVRLGTMTLIAVLVMSFDARNFPVEPMRPVLQNIPPVLAPLAGALKFAVEQDDIALVSLAVLGGYTLLMLVFALVLSGTRELVLD
ncbi:MAG TPA: hypothetical protein VFH60_12330 [Chloroflexia bacterium]|nr:hypothetical protein [Chloroflexia bacterium]